MSVNAFMLIALSALAAMPARPKVPTDKGIDEMVRAVQKTRIEADVKTLVGFGTRNTMSDTESDTQGIGAARKWIKSEFEKISAESGGRLKVELDGYHQEPDGNRIVKPVEIVNVVATLPGIFPDSESRIYIMCAHYDSICSDPKDFTCAAPGANDNGSGVAALLEAARVMAKHEFDATIKFVAFAGEEQGLLGSKYMAQKASKAGVDIAGVLNNDIIGGAFGTDGELRVGYVRAFSEGTPLADKPEDAELRLTAGGENDSQSRQLARFAADCADQYVPAMDVMLMYRVDRLLRGGDHKSFNVAGYPAIRFTESIENLNYQHQNVREENGFQYGDLPKFLHLNYAGDVTQVNVATLASLARSPARPRNVRLLIDKPTKETRLRWDANSEADLAGYMIVWRETASPTWQFGTLIASTNEHRLPYCKDDYFFGICAMDRDSHVSEAAYAKPAKE